MIDFEADRAPDSLFFDLAIVAIGFERRCRWITQQFSIKSHAGIGLEFGFLAEGSYQENRTYFQGLGFQVMQGLRDEAVEVLSKRIISLESKQPSVFVDISSMSREMIANVAIAIQRARSFKGMLVTVAYAPSKFSAPYDPAPIRSANPIKPSLAGWSSRPETPLGAIFGLGCEPGLALGALQMLEPDKAWIFKPKGIDGRFDVAMKRANEHIEEIFDISAFTYDIAAPAFARGRLEALLNAVDRSFRLVIVPFGPKIFAWLSISTILFCERNEVGIWAFSSKEQARVVDRDAQGHVIWHTLGLKRRESKGHESFSGRFDAN